MTPEDFTQISLGKFKVGLTGLKEAISEVKVLRGLSEEEIAQALGVFGTPALLINNELKSMGQLPSKTMLTAWLQEAARSSS